MRSWWTLCVFFSSVLGNVVESTRYAGWTGSWELKSRSEWTPWLEFLGVPEARWESVTTAPDFHRYIVTETSFTMDHRIPSQNMHLHFTSNIDGVWTKCPYPQPTATLHDQFHKSNFAGGMDGQWRHDWVQGSEGKAFQTEIVNFAGRGKTVRFVREITEEDVMEFTVFVLGGSPTPELGPFRSVFHRTGALMPEAPEAVSLVAADHSQQGESDRTDLHGAVVALALEHDSVVSSKISARGLAHSGGMVAVEDVVEGELLISVPVKLHLSLRIARRVSPLVEQVELIPDLALQHPAMAAFLAQAIEEASEDPACCGVFGPYLRLLGTSDLSGMPFLRPASDLELLKNSPEYYIATRYEYWYDHDILKIQSNVPRGSLNGFNATNFVRGSLLVASRAYATPHGEALVPVAEMLNHRVSPNTVWGYHDESDTLRITAVQNISAGEEVTTSYGERSNPRLFSTYGFTVHPHLEPFQSFRLMSGQVHILEPTLKINELPVDLQLSTQGIEDGFAKLFMEASAQDHDVISIFERVVQHNLDLYNKDPLLVSAIEDLRRTRAVDPTSSTWWESSGADATDQWRTNVLRVKMSEYVCLLAHGEMLEVYRGRADIERVLIGAQRLLGSLINFLERISEDLPTESLTEEATAVGSSGATNLPT